MGAGTSEMVRRQWALDSGEWYRKVLGLRIPECCGQAVGPGYLRMVEKYGALDT
jgi:hypothetical protein